MDLSIVIPVYNSEVALRRVVEGVLSALEGSSFEIILVNDGSTDGSAKVCHRLMAAHPKQIRYLGSKENTGEYNAVRVGLKSGVGNMIAVMDDDGQNTVDGLQALIEKIKAEDCDVVYASYDHRSDPWVRRILSRLNDMFAKLVLNKPPDLTLSSFKIMKREFVQRLLEATPPIAYFDFLILKLTPRIATANVPHAPSLMGASRYSFRRLFSLWITSVVPMIPVHFGMGAIGLLHLCALGIRFALVPHESLDVTRFYYHWYDFIRENDGIPALSQVFTDYTPPYTYLLTLMVAFQPWISDLFAIKLIPVMFDFLAAAFMYRIVRLESPSKARSWTAYFAVLFAPTVLLNGAFWGQVDVVFSSFLLGCVFFAIRRQPHWSMIFFALAFSVKLQSVFLVPFILVLMVRRAIPVRCLFWWPVVFFLSLFPCWMLGRPLGSLLGIYWEQILQTKEISIAAPNLYSFLTNVDHNGIFWGGLIISALVGLTIPMLAWKRKNPLTPQFLLETATLSVALMPFVLPKMHDRYFFTADLFSIALPFFNPRLVFVPLIFQFTSAFSYTYYLTGSEWIPCGVLGVMNLLPVGALCWRYVRSSSNDPSGSA